MRRSMVWRTASLALLFVASMATTACDEDPTEIPIEDEMVGIYDPVELRFDPSGSAPEGDILPLIQGTSPQLVVSQTGIFQLAFLDPVTNLIRTPRGEAERTDEGLLLTFESQAAADELLFPLEIELVWDPVSRTLSYTGPAEVSRARLHELFPELYSEEQFFDPTPGTLTVVFDQRTGS